MCCGEASGRPVQVGVRGRHPAPLWAPRRSGGLGAAFPFHAVESSCLTLYTGMSQAAVFFFLSFFNVGAQKKTLSRKMMGLQQLFFFFLRR